MSADRWPLVPVVLSAVRGVAPLRANGHCLAGAAVGGSCWLLGGLGLSCIDVCDAAGFPHDEATATFAGGAGTNANSVAVLDALAVPGTTVTDLICDQDAGVGCTYEPELSPWRHGACAPAADPWRVSHEASAR